MSGWVFAFVEAWGTGSSSETSSEDELKGAGHRLGANRARKLAEVDHALKVPWRRRGRGGGGGRPSHRPKNVLSPLAPSCVRFPPWPSF